MSFAEVADQLPGAMLEETLRPEHVVTVRDDDGTTHLLMYVGKTPAGSYLMCKHAIVAPEHAAMFAANKVPPRERPPAEALAEVVPVQPGRDYLDHERLLDVARSAPGVLQATV